MIGARYAAHYVSFASSMGDPYDPLHAQINAATQRTPPRRLRNDADCTTLGQYVHGASVLRLCPTNARIPLANSKSLSFSALMFGPAQERLD
jgi:hypothetical protein